MNVPKAGWGPENFFDPSDPVFRQASGEQRSGPENLDMAGMNKREQEVYLLHYGPR